MAALGAATAARGADEGNAGAERLVLRLADVGRGYVVGDDSTRVVRALRRRR